MENTWSIEADGFKPNGIMRHDSYGPIPVTARSMAWVCGRSLVGTAGSNPAGGMDACLL